MSVPESFPALQTGATIQYSSDRAVVFRTEVAQFVDGSEQRFPQFPSPILRWTIRLDLLTDGEAQMLLDFHARHRGRGATFSFIDPWTGKVHPSCSFEHDALHVEFAEESQSRMQLVIRSNRE
jgi:hypothetical protein